MQYNAKTNDGLRYKWNNYKDNSPKSLRAENHKQEGFFANIQRAAYCGFVSGTEIGFTDKTDSPDTDRRDYFWLDTVKTDLKSPGA